MCYVVSLLGYDAIGCSHGVFQAAATSLFAPYHRGIRYLVRSTYDTLPGGRGASARCASTRRSLRAGLLGNLGAPLTTATRAPTSSRVRNDSSTVQPCASAAVQPRARPCGGTTAPKPCSPQATSVHKKNKNKRDILRRTAMHASHRRELLVPRERRRPVESQRASSYTPREFMAVQKRRFFVLPMPSHRRP